MLVTVEYHIIGSACNQITYASGGKPRGKLGNECVLRFFQSIIQ